jgi:hypothetical protein
VGQLLVRLKPDATIGKLLVRLKPDATIGKLLVRLKPDATIGKLLVRLKPDATKPRLRSLGEGGSRTLRQGRIWTRPDLYVGAGFSRPDTISAPV